MYKILIADDEELEREALHLFVAQSGIAAIPAAECATGTELIKKCAEIQPDIIILDINMPGLNGLEALGKIRQTDCSALVIISSAYDQFDYAVTAMQLGVINFLVKPVKKEVFIGALKKAIGMLDERGTGSPQKTGKKECSRNLMPENIRRIFDFIENNYSRQFSLEDLSEYCGCSRFHLSHIFSSYTGMTISSFVLEKRISRAKELLATTVLSIKEISACTGFSDPNYLSLVFKKSTGISPVQYRSSQSAAGSSEAEGEHRKSL